MLTLPLTQPQSRGNERASGGGLQLNRRAFERGAPQRALVALVLSLLALLVQKQYEILTPAELFSSSSFFFAQEQAQRRRGCAASAP
jgi:hypothetical protein